MDWPTPQEYNESIQSPAICFADASLKAASVEVGPLGLPRPSTGAFASVYKLSGKDGSYAVRCFHTDIPDLAYRYAKILEELNQIEAPWRLETEFLEHGIKVQGRWFPLVKMAWVEGLPLDRFLAKFGSNQTKLNKLSTDIKSMLSDLRSRGIAHGDLQHGNILVADDEVKLIDYDGFYVPALLGFKSAELGHANYQHPYRSREHFGSYIDNFPAWLISISLMMLACDPALLEVGRDRECLLFSHADLVAPYESALFSRLREHAREEIREAARTLIRLLSCPVEFIPFLDASDEELLDLPELDPSEQMRLIEEISQTDSLRFIERPPALAALEKLSTAKRTPKDKISFLLRQVSTKGGELLSNVLQQRSNSHDYAKRGDSEFAAGNIQESIEAYVKASSELPKDREAQLKRFNKFGTQTTRSQTLSSQMFDYDQFEDHLNLRLGTCHLLNNNAASAAFHYKSVLAKFHRYNVQPQTIDALAGLIMSYCQLGRLRDAEDLLKEHCGGNDSSTFSKGARFSAQNLSCTFLGYGNGPLAEVRGLKLALKMVASYFQKANQYEYAASLYTTARSQREFGSANDLDLMLHIGHCHLMCKRPDLAIGMFNSILQFTAPEHNQLHDRAAVGLAVAFKMMNSRQDVVKAMRSRMPENLYNCFKAEINGPLGNLEELGEVICAFAAELGESNLMEGLRKATRLAADNFKRLDDKRIVEEIVGLLNEGKFSEADKLASEEILSQGDLKSKFHESAQAFARNLTNCGAYRDAFHIVDKYKCPDAVVIEAMEGQVIRYLKSATRQLKWEPAGFNDIMLILEELGARGELSDFILRALSDFVCASSDRSEAYLFDVRRLADLIALVQSDGASNPHVLKIRMFALTAETRIGGTPLVVPQNSKPQESRMAQKFSSASKASKLSAAEHIRLRKLEGEVLQILRRTSRNVWEAKNYEELENYLDNMKTQRYLSAAFSEKIATILQEHFSQSSGYRRWQKDYSTTNTDSEKKRIRHALEKLMDTFSTIPEIDPGTLRKIQRSIDQID